MEKYLAKQALKRTTQEQASKLSGQKRADFLLQNQLTFVERTSAQSIANNAWSSIHWNGETSDDPGWFDPAADTRITVTYAGWYSLELVSAWQTNSFGMRHLGFLQNGAYLFRGQSVDPNFDGNARVSLPLRVFAEAGDYFEAQVYQDSGGSINLGGLSAPTHNPHLCVTKII